MGFQDSGRCALRARMLNRRILSRARPGLALDDLWLCRRDVLQWRSSNDINYLKHVTACFTVSAGSSKIAIALRD